MVYEMGPTSNNNKKIQLFISFRGQDERLKLLSHLKPHLERESKVNVFIDDGNVGEPLRNLYKHIRNSRIVIVIFSINYLESCWCLNELVHIRKCLMTEKIDFVIPIFYNVEPSHVKDQSGEFGKRFVALQEKHPESVRKWTKALLFVANYGGLAYDKNDSISEYDFIMAVVETVNIVSTKITSKDGHKVDVDEIMNMLYHYSDVLAALDLERQRSSLQNYNRGIYMKEQSRINPYIEEFTLADNPTNVWRDFVYKRNNSVPNIFQIYPPLLSDETEFMTTVQYHPDAYELSIDDIRQNESIVVHDHSVINQVSNNDTKEVENQESNEKKVENKYRSGVNNISSLVYCFGFGCILLLVIHRFRRKDTSIRRN